MATKKPQTFKSFDELDPDRVIITGNVNIVNDDPIIDTTKKGASNMASKKKEEAAPAADVKPTNEELKPQETKQPAADAKKAEAKETKSEENKTNKGEEKMSKENENKEVKPATETKPKTTVTTIPATPAAPSFMDDPEIKKLLDNIKDGKINVEVEHKQPSAGDEFLRGLAWGGGIAVGVTAVTLIANAIFGGGESSAE